MRLLLSCFLLAGFLALDVSVQGQNPGKKQVKKPGEVNTPPARGERKNDSLRVGDPAPDFSLPRLKDKGEVKLSSFQGKKPVVLIFGSYT